MPTPVTAPLVNSLPSASSSIQPILDTGSQDVFLQMELFFANSAGNAATNAVEVMKRAKASRTVNDAKKAFNGSGISDGNGNFKYGGAAQTDIGNWLANFAQPDPAKPGTYLDKALIPTTPQYEDKDIQKMKQTLDSLKADNTLNGEEKAAFDDIMLKFFKFDENGQEVLSDEIMTVMLQQANALYQNWLSGFQKISSSRVETLKELVRALS